MSLSIFFFFARNILNGSSTQGAEYKINNVPVKLFSWEEPQKPQEDKSFKVVQKSEMEII